MRKGAETRERIMEIAEASVLAKGFGATSIEEVIAEAGITKSGFFYHFKDKNELARDMMLRYVEENDRIFDDVFSRGRQLSDDPLQSFLITLKLLAETHGRPAERPPRLPRSPRSPIRSACSTARCATSSPRAVQRLERAVPRRARTRSRAFIRRARHVDLDDVADMFSCVVDGGIIMSQGARRPAPCSSARSSPSAAS